MKPIFNGLIFLSLLILFFSGLHSFSVYRHELVHQQILYYAGSESTINFVGFFGGVTIPDENTENDLSNMDLAHSVNEAVGYQVVPLLEMIVIMQFALILLFLKRGWKNDERKNR